MNRIKADSLTENQLLNTNKQRYVPETGSRRYSIALKNLIPIRGENRDAGTSAIDSAGLFSSIGLSWMSKIMYKAHKEGLKMEELPGVSPYDTCDYNADRLELICRKELAKKGRSKATLSIAAWKFCQTRIIISLIIYAGGISCGILSFSVFMRKLLDYVESDDVEYEEGVKWAFLITASELLRIMLLRWSTVMNHRTGIRLRSACLTLLYRKIIRANNLQQNSIGEVINMFSNDAQRMYDLLSIGPQIIEAPIITVFLIVYISSVLSPIALVGIAVCLLYYPIEYVMSQFIRHFRNKAIKISDKRISLMNEILDSVKLIKMYAWENRFSQDLLGLREKELKLILKTSCSQHLSIAATQTMPVISAIIAFLLHAKTGNILTAAQLFPCSTMIDSQLRVALINFRDASQSMVLAGISFKRIQKALLRCRKNEPKSEADEGETEELKKLEINTDHVDVLFNISFEAARGKLVGICGPVGSGKSSLLLAILGQLRVSEGQVTRDGDCAYVSQQAWITNATLRENILFGADFDEIRYDKVIQACSLIQDIAMMPGGDQTEIGERGINLSGGQKQRVALARALYSDRDIFLLDDPLSAVDSRVGSSIFDNLILGALKEKTVVFVTHQTQYLSHCDDVYMMRGGRIVEHGTHDELIKLNNEYASLIASASGDGETENNTPENLNMITIPKSVDDVPLETRSQRHTDASPEMNNTNVDTESELTANPTGASLTVAEELRQGTVKARTYHSYIVAAGGYGVAFMAIFMYCTALLSNAFSFWWLALWIEAGGSSTTTVGNIATEPSDMTNVTIISQNVNENSDPWYYYTIYAWMIAIIALTNTLRGLVFSRATVAASTRIHKNLFKKILNCPMRFFDTTPTGRIQHLFSRDMDEVDVTLPSTLAGCTVMTLRVITSVLITCLVFPWYILPVCLTAILYYYVSRILRVAVGDLKNMENKSRGPVISHVTETVQGLNTIHAFGKEKNFSAKFAHLFDENSKHLFMFNLSIIWFEIRIEILALAAISFTAFLVIIFKGQVSPSLAGLAIAYSVQIAGILPYLWTLLSQTDARMSSVERLNYYIRTVEKEGCTNKSVITPLSTWPAVPGIKFTNVSMAYGDRAPLILKNVSFYVHAGEKIGIVGRTGAGKSSLTIALFRLVELVEGKIEIDDVDISQITLRQLRTKLSIIPQDPVLFSGTVRSNLDPFKLYSDAEIWDALDKTELKSRVQSISGQLDATVGFGGDNMSVGERQLLCLSRALLRNSKILVLDEATASVDPGTEKAVQDTIQREFSQCTILTIAHRLQTVNSLNRVLVMDDGQVLEFDTPANLLANPCSQFSKMTEAAERAGSQ